MKRIINCAVILCLILLSISTASSQEIRGMMGIQVYGGLSGAFVGPGVGIESNLGKHFTINSDFNFGFQEKGMAFEFKPAIHFYFRSDAKGFFIGPSLKWVSINESGNADNFANEVYAVGLSLGLKSNFKDRINYFISTSPHYSVGSSSRPGALGGVGGLSLHVGLAYEL